MARQFKVAPRCSVILPNGEARTQGQIITESDMPADKIKEHLRSEFLVHLDEQRDPSVIPGTNPVAVAYENDVNALSITGGPTITPKQLESVQKPETEPPARVVVPEMPGTLPPPPQGELKITDEGKPEVEQKQEPVDRGAVANAISPWSLDPATLADKTLLDLNLMIAERDSTLTLPQTVEEARAFLSQDFGKT